MKKFLYRILINDSNQIDSFNTNNSEDNSITKFRVINSKNISTLKTENVPIKFIDSTIYFILTEMRNTIEQRYLKEIEDEEL